MTDPPRPGPSRDEVPLAGGRLTAGVVRVGETVRRPASAASAFVRSVLTHLESKHFTGCPRHCGFDERGREILTFLPGEVPARWRSFTDEQVTAGSILLRRMHDATREFAEKRGGGDVVCHHDPGPNNTVFDPDGVPIAFIDFDLAAVGDPLEDLGYMAWSWCIASRPDRGPARAQARQVRILADAYGLTAAQRRRLPGAIGERFTRNEIFWRQALAEHRPGLTPQRVHDIVTWTRQEATFWHNHLPLFTQALAAGTG